VKQLFYLCSIATSLLNPFGTLRFLELSNRAVFINKNITHKKHLKRKTGSQKGIFLL
jgi:hypothetical protein